MKKVHALVFIFLAGCANMQNQAIKNSLEECKAKWAAPKFDSIRTKVSAFEKHTSTRYFLVDHYVADSEKELLLQYADLKDECANTAFDYALESMPWVLPALAAQQNRNLISFSELYYGRITYAEFNRLNSQSYSMYLDQMQKLHEEYMRLDIAARQNQIQAGQALFQAAKQFSTPQAQLPKLQGNTMYTNCQWLGQQMQCNTRTY